MTQRNELQTQPNQPVSLVKPILVGAGIALLVISFFVFGVDEANPAWGKFWMIRPLIVFVCYICFIVFYCCAWW